MTSANEAIQMGYLAGLPKFAFVGNGDTGVNKSDGKTQRKELQPISINTGMSQNLSNSFDWESPTWHVHPGFEAT